MPRSLRSFLAPVFFELGEVDESGNHRGRNYRSVGLTSLMGLRKLPPGMRCLWPAPVPVEVASSETSPEWERFSVVVVPNNHADRTRIYGWLTLRGETAFVGPDQVALVVPPGDPSARDGFTTVELAKIPEEFWAAYGPDYGGPRVGEYFPEGYRVTCEFVGEAGGEAPTSWVEYRQSPSGRPPYPLPDIAMLSEADKARHKRRAEDRAQQILKGGR